ncbi:CHASE2 domain-containing protein [Paraburkholderia sp. LEh10]|jgi:CHASE2 domain-containing sensor protein|uniref:CHASE2 domain-containing protein n=1 Tax=Paraburkholderia sp. LEh10 TaxID=2821353 RepID=UPI001AE1B9FA|nr:CHASE2 domain-containing protein [Paraburkholderia sp. LEh10]MBP0590527.1 CHASE2 domain-containing protein [Paraburkholderia sp. LEh10]
MKRYCACSFNFVRTMVKAYQGRPWALTVLFALILFNLLSEWPGNLPRPAFLDRLDAVMPDTFGSARQLLFDHFQRRSPRIPTSQPVTIVEIDDKTLEAIGQWPWPRNRLANLVDAIAAKKPLAIGLDIYMPEPDQTSPARVADNLPSTADDIATQLRALPSHERILATSLRASPSVLGAVAFDHATSTTSTDLLSSPILVHGADPLDKVHRFKYVLASLPELQGASHGQAMLNVAQEQGTVRRIPLIMGLGDKMVPGLPIEMLRVATGSPAVEVFADNTGVQALGVADVRVPTQPDGDVWLHFASIQATQHRYVSALDVLRGKADADRFRNKLVLVGLTGTGLTDMRTTALGELVPGIEIQAQAIETIFEGRFLRRPLWLKWAEIGFIVGFGLLLIWYVPRTNSRFAAFVKVVPKAYAFVGVTLNVLLFSICFVLFRYFGLLADAASIFIILSAVMGSFFSASLLANEAQVKTDAARAQTRGEIKRRAGKAHG